MPQIAPLKNRQKGPTTLAMVGCLTHVTPPKLSKRKTPAQRQREYRYMLARHQLGRIGNQRHVDLLDRTAGRSGLGQIAAGYERDTPLLRFGQLVLIHILTFQLGHGQRDERFVRGQLFQLSAREHQVLFKCLSKTSDHHGFIQRPNLRRLIHWTIPRRPIVDHRDQ